MTTVVPGAVYIVSVGGTAVTPIPANANGGIITNPQLKIDQNIANAEPLFVNPYGPATLLAQNTTFSLAPGQSWAVIPGQTTATSVNAATSGHRFSVVYW